MKHDFEQLGDRRFQEFAQALLVSEYPDLACLPVGMPDGGRDAISRPPHGNRKDGRDLLIFQVKYCTNPAHLDDPEAWTLAVIEKELPKIEKLVERGATDYFLVTNVPATSHLDAGSHDKVQAVLAGLPLAAQCLWRGDLDRRLESSWDLKWAYPDLMTGNDLIRALVEGRLSENSERRTRAIRSFLAAQYRADREVHFKQADLHNDLLSVFVDVPVGIPPAREGAPSTLNRRLRELESQSERRSARRASSGRYLRARPSVGAGTILLDSAVQAADTKMVVEGVPGQGKSTMVQYVCQVHRMRLLEKANDLDRLPEAHRVGRLRLPFKVDLRDFAQWQEGISPFPDGVAPHPESERSLETFLAASVQHHSGGATFDVNDLHAIVATNPVLVALDGLDEVAEMERRAKLVDAISIAVDRLDSIAMSVQVVVTTRPASFTSTGRFPTRQFEYVKLTDVTPELIEDYRDRWMSALDLRKAERVEISAILNEKLGQPHFRDLARNPMQLAILLGLIHRKGPALPDRRTALYSSYMEIFLDREATKSNAVRDHRDLLLTLHGCLAWQMHSAAERSPRGGGRITTDELIAAVGDFLETQGRLRDLFEDLFGGVIDRFGALNSRLEGTLEFEVLPLREYFAASYLYETAPYVPAGASASGTLPERFDAMLKRPLWLNVTRFYAGFYNMGELASLIDRMEAFSEDKTWHRTPTPRNTALHLLSDRTFSKDLRALNKAVALVAAGFGDRHAIVMGDGGLGGEAPPVLPDDGGADELAQLMFRRALVKPMRRSRIGMIAAAIQANGDSDEIAERWLTEAQNRSGTELDDWFAFGAQLDTLCRFETKEIESLLGDDVTPGIVRAVLRGNAPGVFDYSRLAGTRAACAILDEPLPFPPSLDSNHPISALVNIVGCDYHVLSREARVFFGSGSWQDPVPVEPDDHAEIMALSVTYAHEAESDVTSWLREVKPWNAIVEHARVLFGERYAFDRLALIASGIRDPVQRGAGHSDLFDESRSLVLRARSARHRGGDAAWWESRLMDPNASDRQRRLAASLLVLWGDRTSLRTNIEALTKLVDEMTHREFHRMASTVSAARQTFELSNESDRRPGRIKSGELPLFSSRLFALIGPRLPDKQRHSTYADAQYSVSQTDPEVVHSLLAEETRLVGRSSASWDRMLGLLTAAEVTGASVYSVVWKQRSDITMPTPVARAVVDEPSRFPLEIVMLAERVLERQAVRSALSVGRVAEDSAWFS